MFLTISQPYQEWRRRPAVKPDNLQRPARCQIRRCKSRDEDLRLFQALRRLSGRLFLCPAQQKARNSNGSSSFYIRIRDGRTSRQDLRPDLRRDPRRHSRAGPRTARVACECTVTTGVVHVMGEITTDCYVDIPKIVRQTVREIGYDRAKYGFDCETCAVLITNIDEQSAGHRPRRRPVAREQGDRRQCARQRRGRSGHDVRLRLRRDARSSCRCPSRWRTSWPSA